MDCKRVWLHSPRYSQHLTGALAICDARRRRGIFTFINFTLWNQSILLYVALSNQNDPVIRAMLELSVVNVEKEMRMVKEGRKSNSEDGRLRWIDDVRWKMFKVSHLREIERTNNSSCRCWRHRSSSLHSPRTWDWIEGTIPAESDPWPPRLAGWATHS